jgi:hypothetical protein
MILWALLTILLANPTLAGRVTDRAGKPVPGATVRALVEGRAPTESVTNNSGRFRLEIFGPFQLEVRQAGYRTLLSAANELSGDAVYQVVVPLTAGDPAVVENVTLEVENPDDLGALNQSGVSGVSGAAEGLPRSDRLFGSRGGINLTGIAEGQGQQWVAASGNVFTSSTMGSAGTAISAGSETRDEESLPAGQNSQHGSVYGFHRNDGLNARNFFDPPDSPIPPFKYYFFGADTGGRIRDRTHYYVQYWGLRIRQSITRAATVPDPRWLTGDFSMLPDALIDPDSGLPFPGNRIPTSRFSPIGLAFASIYPAPDTPGAVAQNYRAVGRISTAADSTGIRLDRRITASDEGTFEYQFARDTTDDPFNLLSGITNLPFFGVRDALQSHSLRLADTHVFSAAKIAQFRFSLNALKQPRTLLQSATSAEAGPALLITGLSNLGYAANTPQNRRNRAFEWAGDLTWRHQASVTKFGGAVRHFPFEASLDLYTRGQFQFTNGISGHPFANLLLGYPSNALRLEGDTSRRFATSTVSAFLDHSWQLFPRVSMTAGLRYDYQTPYRERDGRAANFDPEKATLEVSDAALYQADRNNFAPRVGISALGPRGVVLRAGYGLFYDTIAVGDSLFLLGLNPPFVRFVVRNNGDVLPQFNLETAFTGAAASTPPSIFSASRHLPNPYVQHWDVSLEREVIRNLVVAVSYFGQKGTRLRRQLNLNQPTAGSAFDLDQRRPFPAFRNIFQFETSASSIAHVGELRVGRNFGAALRFATAYRFSKIIDDATLISMLPQDSHNLRGERGLADFDVRHRLEFSADWDLPGWARFPLTERWQMQAAGTLQSGMPLSAVVGTDRSGTGSPIMNRPDLVGDPRVDQSTPSRFFNPAAFAIPEPERFGTSGRNVITGPGTQNVDLALVRSFRTSDVTRLQFRLDAYNVLNHPNFVAPPSLQNLADSQDFGALFIARSPRILQIGLKFLW